MLAIGLPARSQEPSGLSGLKQDSSTVVDLRTPSDERLLSYKNDEAFNYAPRAVEPEYQWLIIKWVVQAIRALRENEVTNFIIRHLFYIIFIGVLILLINQLMKGQLSTVFSRKSQTSTVSFETEEDTVTVDELDRRIDSALENRDYNLAVKLIYRKALLRLADAGLVTIRPEKTNHEYLHELGGRSLTKSFERMTLYYEFAEYGNFMVDGDSFNKFNNIYQQLEQQITSKTS